MDFNSKGFLLKDRDLIEVKSKTIVGTNKTFEN